MVNAALGAGFLDVGVRAVQRHRAFDLEEERVDFGAVGGEGFAAEFDEVGEEGGVVVVIPDCAA